MELKANAQIIEHGFMSASDLIKMYLPFSIRGLQKTMNEHMDIELGFIFYIAEIAQTHCKLTHYAIPITKNTTCAPKQHDIFFKC